MDSAKRQRLEAKGWSIGTVEEFLGLSPEESALVELKLSLSRYLKELRASKNISQYTLAQRIDSSQSRVAKMETGDASLDLIVRALLSAGATRKEIAEVIMRDES